MPPPKRQAEVIPIHTAKPAPKPGPVHPFDRLYGTDTSGLIPHAGLLTGHAHDPYITAYYAVAPSILNTLVDLWLQTSPPHPIDHYTFLDIGAGKGRAMLTAALHPFGQVIGVEINPTLAAIARENIRIFAASPYARPLAPATLIEADVLAFPLPHGPTVAFLFHPFEAPLLRRFLALIEQHLAGIATPAFDLLYVNAELSAVLDRHPAFTRLFNGMIPMSPEDHLADLAEIAEQTEYGSTGDEFCTVYRFTGRKHA